MGQIIKVRCNGANKHINEVDVDDAMRKDTLTREINSSSSPAPERIVLRCHECVDGKVIVTREMIDNARQ